MPTRGVLCEGGGEREKTCGFVIVECLTRVLTTPSFSAPVIKHTPKKLVFSQFHVTPEDGLISRNIYIVFVVFLI